MIHFKIKMGNTNKNLFYIALYNGSRIYSASDISIADFLNLNYCDYSSILEKHGAKLSKGDREYFLNSKKQCEKAIMELEPYLIMSNLLG